MKATPSPLLAHFQSSTITRADLYKVQWENGTILGFTDHDSDITALGMTFNAMEGGFSASDVSGSDTLAVDNLEIQGVLSSSLIVQADIDAGLWDNAYVTQYRCNYADLSMGVDYVQTGRLGNIQTGLQQVVNEIRGLTQAMARNVVRLIGPDCQHDFCDSGGVHFGAGCALDPAAWTTTGTAEALSADGLTILDSARTEASPYFVGGMVTFTSGLNNGLKMETRTNAVGSFTLSLPLPFDIAIGDTYSILAGCDKSLATCMARSNALNHGGFADLPGVDRVLLAADRPAPGGSGGGKF